VTEFGGTAIETHTGLETAKYLDSELNRRLDNFGARYETEAGHRIGGQLFAPTSQSQPR
jgi:hypothetical protein